MRLLKKLFPWLDERKEHREAQATNERRDATLGEEIAQLQECEAELYREAARKRGMA